MELLKVAWLAGIVDGEGSLFCSLRPYKKEGKPRLEHVFAVGMTHLDTMKEIQRLLWQITGRKYKLRQSQHKSRHKICYTLSIARKAALKKLLETITPLLITKKRQAELMLRVVGRPRFWGGPGKTEERPAWIQECVDEIQNLNRKGIPREAAVAEPVQT